MDWSKFEAFADNIINVTEILKFVLGRVGNIVGKTRKYWLSAFSLFPTMFHKVFFCRVIKSHVFWCFSDLCAGLIGGLGVTPSGNIGEDGAIFESVSIFVSEGMEVIF